MRFDEKFAKLCDAKGLTNQRSLADMLEVSKSTVNRWLSGESTPDIHEGFRIAKLLGVPLDYLVDEEMSEPEGLSEEQRKVLWAAETVGYELALKRIMRAPESKAPAGLSWGELKGPGGEGRSEED